MSSFLRGICVSAHEICSSMYAGGFNSRNKCLTAKLLKQGYRCRGLGGAFSGFCRRRCGLVSKFNVGLGSLLHQGLSEPEFYGDLVCRFGKIGVWLIFWSVWRGCGALRACWL